METAMMFALVIISAITLLYTSCKAEDKRKFDYIKIDNINLEEFADYLIENASEAFEHKDRELLIGSLKKYIIKTIVKR